MKAINYRTGENRYMKTKIVNDELVFAYQDGFNDMSEEEIRGLSTPGGAPAVSVRDPEKKIVAAVGFKTVNGFSAMMLNTKDIAKHDEPALAEAMKNYGYKLDQFVSEKLGEEDAEGFRYDYKVQDVEMSAEMLVVKQKKNVYYIHFYYRTANKEESLAVLDEILKASSLK